MNGKFLLVVLACLLTNVSSAQVRERPKKDCLRICKQSEFPQNARLHEQLLEIRKQKEQELDIRKKNELEDKEQALIERRDDYIDKTCAYICSGNPEN